MKKLDLFLQKARISKAVRFIGSGNQILDIGSGDGALFRFLEDKKTNFTGIGLDPEAEEKHSDQYNIIPAIFPDNSISGKRFNTITALAVLEHIPKDMLAPFAINCNRHLEPGGLLVITVPSKQVDFILKVLIRLRIIDGMEVDQHYGYDTNWTAPLFVNNGFRLIKHEKFQLGLNNLFVFEKTTVL